MTASESALITIAVAVSIQSAVTLGLAVFAFAAWRKTALAIREEQHLLHARMDEALAHFRTASLSFERLSSETRELATTAQGALTSVGSVVGAVAQGMSIPRRLLAYGAAAGARTLLRRWQLRRPR